MTPIHFPTLIIPLLVLFAPNPLIAVLSTLFKCSKWRSQGIATINYIPQLMQCSFILDGTGTV